MLHSAVFYTFFSLIVSYFKCDLPERSPNEMYFRKKLVLFLHQLTGNDTVCNIYTCTHMTGVHICVYTLRDWMGVVCCSWLALYMYVYTYLSLYSKNDLYICTCIT